jgi:dihydrofolate synthase/folylpolyglutamate synthase
LELMGNPEKALKMVHVAGTNGKGSVTYLIASLLSAAGYRVGRFSSPHLHSYTERFTIDGQEIKLPRFKAYLDHIEEQVGQLLRVGKEHPTEFEIMTALAFQYFKDEEVELAVIEVGLGGVYDSTNVITPLVSVISSVGYEHTEVLGSSLEEIAQNKAGIIKTGIPVVIGSMPEEARKIIECQARALNAPCFNLDEIKVTLVRRPDIQGQEIDIDWAGQRIERVHFGLAGNYQLENLRLSLAAIMLLNESGFILTPQVLRDSLSHLKFPGRLEVLSRQPLVIADAAHNPHAAKALGESLNSILGAKKKILLCGYLDDKNAGEALAYLGENTSRCIVSRPESDRASKWNRVADEWNKIYPGTSCYVQEDIEKAVSLGVQLLDREEYLLITGSFYLLDRARRLFTIA